MTKIKQLIGEHQAVEALLCNLYRVYSNTLDQLLGTKRFSLLQTLYYFPAHAPNCISTLLYSVYSVSVQCEVLLEGKSLYAVKRVESIRLYSAKVAKKSFNCSMLSDQLFDLCHERGPRSLGRSWFAMLRSGEDWGLLEQKFKGNWTFGRRVVLTLVNWSSVKKWADTSFIYTLLWVPGCIFLS